MWRFHLFWKTGKENLLLPVILVFKVGLVQKTQPASFESIVSFRVDGASLSVDTRASVDCRPFPHSPCRGMLWTEERRP